MKNKPRTSSGKELTDRWDGMTFMERLMLIMDHTDLFWSLRLITTSEIAMVDAMPESAREYILNREDQPWFTSLQLKREVATQSHRDKLKAALRVVFE